MASLCTILLFFLCKIKIVQLKLYLIIGIFIWYFFLKSGIHPTIAGIVLAMFIPIAISRQYSPLTTLKTILTPYVEIIILPLFTFVNSGIHFESIKLESLCHSVTIGIVLGLVIGKPFGISLAIHILKYLRILKLEDDIRIEYYYIVSILSGIGFTMSIFIALIAFKDNYLYLQIAKSSIVLGSLISATTAVLAFYVTLKKNK